MVAATPNRPPLRDDFQDSAIRVTWLATASQRLSSFSYFGYFSNFGSAGFIWSHGCASAVHTSICKLNPPGSSRLAVRIATIWGCESVLTTIGEPHSGQKPRRVMPPASLGKAWKRGEPCRSLNASAGTMTYDENGPPLARWQSRQWQWSISTGFAVDWWRTAPQAHPPEKGVVIVVI